MTQNPVMYQKFGIMVLMQAVARLLGGVYQ